MKIPYRQIPVILLCIAGMLTRLPAEAQNSESPIEQELVGWKPTAHNSSVPRDILRTSSLSLEGEWLLFGGLWASSLTLKPVSAQEYSVHFTTAGCLESWKLSRSGRYSEGVLTLDHPVKDYVHGIYQTLYVVKSKGEIFLVPDIFVKAFEKQMSRLRGKITPKKLLGYGYRQETEKTVSAKLPRVSKERVILAHVPESAKDTSIESLRRAGVAFDASRSHGIVGIRVLKQEIVRAKTILQADAQRHRYTVHFVD